MGQTLNNVRSPQVARRIKSMKREKKDAKATVVFDAIDNEFVRDLNEIRPRFDQCGRDVGRRVARYIEDRGGTAYGDQTIEHIASHPEMCWSSRQLRRYWAFDRLNEANKNLTKGNVEDVKDSHLYEVARLIDAEFNADDPNKLHEARMELITRTIDWLNRQAEAGHPLGVNECGKAITRILKDSKKGIIQPERNLDTQGSKVKEPRSKIARVIAFRAGGFGEAVDYIEQIACKVESSPEAFDAAQVTRDLNRLAQQFLRMMIKLGAAVNPDDELIAVARSAGQALLDFACKHGSSGCGEAA